jgi:FAD dependent oxidoreductase
MKHHRMEQERCDVLIVGGGATGYGAALALQGSGASYMILERSERFGGKATNAMVGTICGAFLRSQEETPRWVLTGRVQDFCKGVMDWSGTAPERGTNGLWYVPYRIEAFHEVAMMPKTGINERTRLGVHVVSCDVKDSGITRVQVSGASGSYAIASGAVIDCTGSAALSRLCGADVIAEHQYQAPSQVFFLSGIRADDAHALELAMMRALMRATAKGDEQVAAVKHIGLVHGSLSHGSVGVKATLRHRPENGEDLEELNALGHRTALQVAQFLRQYVDACSTCTVKSIAPEMGVRTEQRPLGKHILAEVEVLAAKKPADGVAVGAWPIEHWGNGPGADMQWLPEGEHYLIPAGALESASVEGLYFAGRGISASEMAIASARVMGTCLSTGYAAGVLAAYHALGKSRAEAIARLRAEQLPT